MNTAAKGVIVLTKMLDAGETWTEFLRVGTLEECQQWYEFQWQQVIAAHPDLTVQSFISGTGGIDGCHRCVSFKRNGEPEYLLHEYRERHFLYAEYVGMIEAAVPPQPTKLMLYTLPTPDDTAQHTEPMLDVILNPDTPQTPASVDGFLFGDVKRLQAHELHDADGAPVEDKDARIRQLEALLSETADVVINMDSLCIKHGIHEHVSLVNNIAAKLDAALKK